MNNDRQSKIEGLRRLADFLEANPDFALPYDFTAELSVYVDGKESFVNHARMLRTGTKGSNDTFFYFTHDFGGGINVQIVESRNVMCEKVIVRTEEIEVEEPDPVALAQLPKVKVRRLREVVDWKCPELLAAG